MLSKLRVNLPNDHFRVDVIANLADLADLADLANLADLTSPETLNEFQAGLTRKKDKFNYLPIPI